MSFGIGEKSQSSRGRTQVLMEEAIPAENQAALDAWQTQMYQQGAFNQGLDTLAQDAGSYLTQLQDQLGRVSTENLMRRAQGGALLSPGDQAALDAIYAPIEARGMESIKQMAHDLAASRGLSPSDSPIGVPALQEVAKFQRDLSGQRAQSALDLGTWNQQFNQGLADFQSRLKQQASANRLAWSTAQNPGMQAQDQLYGQRLARAGQTYNNRSVGSQWNAGIDIGQILSAAGSAAAMCWIAAAIYGAGTPEYWLARNWIMHEWKGPMADLARRAYRCVGPWLGDRPRLARLLKPLFDMAVERG